MFKFGGKFFKIGKIDYITNPYPDAAYASPPLPIGRGIFLNK